MHLHLTGQHVAVIGSSNGIGRAIAEGFLAEGCHVRGFDRALPGTAVAFETTLGDVTSFEELKAFAATFPAISHVVFTVGVGSGKFGFPFWNLAPSDWARVLDINLIGAVNVAHAFAPGLIARGAGSYLVLTSVAGQMGSQTDPPYSAAKAGLINFMQCAAKDFAPHNIRVNALAPGLILGTSFHTTHTTAESVRATVAGIPLGRGGSAADVARAAVFLAGEFDGFITGATLDINGGVYGS